MTFEKHARYDTREPKRIPTAYDRIEDSVDEMALTITKKLKFINELDLEKKLLRRNSITRKYHLCC